jgi:hypothetical protein
LYAREKNLAGELGYRGNNINRRPRQQRSVMVGGQKVRFQRTRLRNGANKEVRGESYDRFRENDSCRDGV